MSESLKGKNEDIAAKKFSAYFPCWKELTAEQQKFLSSAVHEYRYPKGTLLHSGSSDCIGLLLVTSGQVRVYTVSSEGRELTLYRLLERDMCLFSASCIMPSIQFDVMVSAEQDSTAFVIPAQIYQTLMERSAAVANYTNELMASHFSDVMWLMDQILNKKLDTRLAAFLLEESALSGSNVVTITHEQIANHLGSVREMISRMLDYFQKEGLVRLGRGNIRLLNLPKLTDLAQRSLR